MWVLETQANKLQACNKLRMLHNVAQISSG